MKILVTGGLGYIGSHTVVALSEAGYEVIIVDNLSNTRIEVVDGIESIIGRRPTFYELDLRNELHVVELFDKEPSIEGVIHFAASKAVGESVENPLLYYENNLSAFIYLLKQLAVKPKSHLIFSSSCTVYGQADVMPITERAPIKVAESPYGNTKQIGEEILKDTVKVSSGLSAIALRYFNPIGAHASAKIGELPLGVPQNLVPFITQTAAGLRKELAVFGDDYPTPDGTCIRDYIHVVDLAEAHVTALTRLVKGESTNDYEIFNLGTGKGSSVLEVIESFEKVSGSKLPYRIAGRREGDVIQAFANTEKANSVLGWKSKYSLDDALASAWAWERKIRNLD
ncbi:MAG: UDP-glucose 4-epimerase GalE [Flavobacteriaceae bacterium]